MILLLHSILFMPSASLSCVLQCESEVNLHLYLHQIAAGPGKPAGFGTLAVNDWTVMDGPSPGVTIVARTKGMHTQAGVADRTWFNYFTMVFENVRDRAKMELGATMELLGEEVMGINGEEGQISIIGGTGEFAMARGIIKYKVVDNPPPGQSIKELNIHAFYVKPAVSRYPGIFQQPIWMSIC
ncbi:hypothetical protein VPH35_012217 [Triticum aestivum]